MSLVKTKEDLIREIIDFEDSFFPAAVVMWGSGDIKCVRALAGLEGEITDDIKRRFVEKASEIMVADVDSQFDKLAEFLRDNGFKKKKDKGV